MTQKNSETPVVPSYDEERVAKQREHDEVWANLDLEKRGKICARCESEPRIGFRDETYQLVCNCPPELQPPVLIPKPSDLAKHLTRITSAGLASADPQVQALTIEQIIQYICPNANTTEAYLFLQVCRALQLNPFLKDAYLIKYSREQREPAQIVIGVNAYRKWAAANPLYDQTRAGVVVRPIGGGPLDYREGTLVIFGEEEIVGGWARVHIKGETREPQLFTVSVQEYLKTRKAYDSERKEACESAWARVPIAQTLRDHYIARNVFPQSTWQEIPATMIAKVGEVQELRRNFPEQIDRLAKAEDAIDAEYTVLDGEPKPVAASPKRLSESRDPNIQRQIAEQDAHKPPDKRDLYPESPPLGTPPAAPRQTVPVAPPAEMRDVSAIKTVGDLLNACREDFKADRAEVMRTLGISDPALIINLQDAYYTVKNAKGA